MKYEDQKVQKDKQEQEQKEQEERDREALRSYNKWMNNKVIHHQSFNTYVWLFSMRKTCLWNSNTKFELKLYSCVFGFGVFPLGIYKDEECLYYFTSVVT